MNEQKWTPKLVADRFEEAASTLKRLPRVRPKGYGSSWPSFVQETLGACEQSTVVARLGPPTGDAITRMDECLDWIRWLDADDARLVWVRATGVQWKLIAQRFGNARSTISAKWVAAVMQVVAILNQKKVSGQFSSGHAGQNLL